MYLHVFIIYPHRGTTTLYHQYMKQMAEFDYARLSCFLIAADEGYGCLQNIARFRDTQTSLETVSTLRTNMITGMTALQTDVTTSGPV